MVNPSDAVLVHRYRAGDERAYQELMEKYIGQVHAIAHSIVLNESDAQDVTQETFIQAYRQLEQLRSPDSFRAWVSRIAVRLALKQKKRSEREVVMSIDELVPTPSPVEANESFERKTDITQFIRQALQSLPDLLRIPLIMYYLGGFSHREIGQALSIGPRTSERRVRRGRQELREYFRRFGLEAEQFYPTGSLNVARQGHTATRLLDGRVLLVGGSAGSFTEDPELYSAEIYDLHTGEFTAVGMMRYPRAGHTAILLLDGSVMIIGGCYQDEESLRDIYNSNRYGAAIERFDPVTSLFSVVGTLHAPRCGHTATLMPNGSILVVGGMTGKDGVTSVQEVERVRVVEVGKKRIVGPGALR